MKRFVALLLAMLMLMASMSILTNDVVAEEYTPSAEDIKDIEGHWASQPIYILINKGIFSGYADNTFRPDKEITRGEYIASLFKTACIMDESISSEEYYMQLTSFDHYGYRNEERNAFLKEFKTKEYEVDYKDLENHWSKNPLVWVKSYSDKNNPGLFESVFPGEKFYPDKPITREEAAVATVAFTKPPVVDKGIEFKDIDKDYKFIDEIKSLVNNEIINGFPDGTFKPEANITRAATATIMQNLMKELAYNMDFYGEPSTYVAVSSSTRDAEYIASFLSEELYENPPTEADEKYVAYFKSYYLDRQLVSDADAGYGKEGFSYDELREEYEERKQKEIPHYRDDNERLDVLNELKDEDYWNKAGLYYWLYEYDESNPIEYLEIAEDSYDPSKNGKEDIYLIYTRLIDYYINNEKDSDKVLDYVEQANSLFVPNKYGHEEVANVDKSAFYTYAANYLLAAEEYEEALNYLNKYLGESDKSGGNYELEKAVIIYKSGQKSQAMEYLKENLEVLESKDYINESLKNKYIWALKTMMEDK